MDIASFITRKRLTYLIACGALILVVIGVYTFIDRIGKTRVDIVTLPPDTTVTVNNRPINSGENYLKPGKYTFKAKRQYFDPLTSQYTIGAKPMTINLLPVATSDEALNFLRRHPQLQAKREVAIEEDTQKIGMERLRKYPFIKQLPIIYDHGESSIGSGESSAKPGETAIIINDISTNGRAADLEIMRQLGYDPADYIIEFHDFTSPLTSIPEED